MANRVVQPMALSFEETLIEVWRQALVEIIRFVRLGSETYPVRRTPKSGLRQIGFEIDGEQSPGLEQNPNTSFDVGAAGSFG